MLTFEVMKMVNLTFEYGECQCNDDAMWNTYQKSKHSIHTIDIYNNKRSLGALYAGLNANGSD